MVERVDLERVRHADRERWRCGGEWDEGTEKIAVGQMADGRWYTRMYAGRVDWIGERVGRVYSGRHAEWYARRTARCWMRTLGGEWVEA